MYKKSIEYYEGENDGFVLIAFFVLDIVDLVLDAFGQIHSVHSRAWTQQRRQSKVKSMGKCHEPKQNALR